MYEDPVLSRTRAPVGEPVGGGLEPLHREVKRRELQPVQAWLERQGSQMILRIPLRAEQVRLEKRTVVTERVAIRRERTEGIASISADVQREQLRVEPIGDVEVTRPFDPNHSPRAARPAQRRDLDATREW